MKPEHLKPWTYPDNYAGATWDGWYVFLGQHRDSDALTRSNFICGLKAAQEASAKLTVPGPDNTFRDDLDEIPSVYVVHESHWAVGWVEWIAIHESDLPALAKADEIREALEDYPVVDETHWSELEDEDAQATWEILSLRDRVDLCRDARVSIFAARHPYPPNDDAGRVRDCLVN